VILSPAAWQNKPGDGAQQRRQRTRRQLLGAIAVAQVKTDDSRVRFELIQERQDAVEKPFRGRRIGIQEQAPFSLTQTAAFIDDCSVWVMRLNCSLMGHTPRVLI
jgi:hypothetical protein